ncbi:MAG: calcium/sodium antiporter [Pirellulaceae bacterium]|jgi:cation:H+ antiporter|nr:calcium/sodium antiporter [Pirellulaceae bacterium]
MTGLTLLLFLLGLVALVVGAEWLVRGSSRLAAAVGVSPLVIGLTVVAFGTSSPELAVSVQAAWSGQADLAVGNVVGSNVFNVLFILGISAVITPLAVARQLLRLDVPVMIVISMLAWVLGLDGAIDRTDGILFVAGVLVYTWWLIRASRREVAAEKAAEPPGEAPDAVAGRVLFNLVLIVAGLAALVLGSRWLVQGAVAIATTLGVSELVIGLTVVAAGTSLPEVAASIAAAVRGERDIAVGNVVGSNIFNILAVLGLSSLTSPSGVQVSAEAMEFDIPVMIAVAVACFPVFYTGGTISRWEGIVFLGYYVAYTAYLILNATQHAGLATFQAAMLWFVIPLTAITLAVSVQQAVKLRRAGP